MKEIHKLLWSNLQIYQCFPTSITPSSLTHKLGGIVLCLSWPTACINSNHIVCFFSCPLQLGGDCAGTPDSHLPPVSSLLACSCLLVLNRRGNPRLVREELTRQTLNLLRGPKSNIDWLIAKFFLSTGCCVACLLTVIAVPGAKFKANVALAIYLLSSKRLQNLFFILSCSSKKSYFLSKEGSVCDSVTVLKELASEHKVREIS